jgi:hypothetical protein
MTALSAATERKKRNIKGLMYDDVIVKSGEQIYQGALVCFDASDDDLVPAADTSGFRFAGIAAQTVLGDGVKTCRVEWHAEWEVTIDANITEADVGALACATDDNEVDDAGGASNDVEVGRVVKLISASKAWVFFDRINA